MTLPVMRLHSKGSEQLRALLAFETAYQAAMRGEGEYPLPSPHVRIAMHTRTLLSRGLVELDPLDDWKLTVRLTDLGREVALKQREELGES